MATGPLGNAGVYLGRWLYFWIVTALVVVLVVVVYLILISNALVNIDDNLQEAADAVGTEGVGGDVAPLPDSVQNVNATLGRIDTSLKPIPGQADQITANLGRISGSLVNVDSGLKMVASSLVDTSGGLGTIGGSLTDTAGSLSDTSGKLEDASDTLKDIRGMARDIDDVLRDAQKRESLGTAEIPVRVRRANDNLRSVERNADGIVRESASIQRNLQSACRAIPLPGEC